MAEDPALPLTDVQFVLGHAQLTTTQIYLTPRKEDVIRRVLAHHGEQARQAAARAGPSPAPGLPARDAGGAVRDGGLVTARLPGRRRRARPARRRLGRRPAAAPARAAFPARPAAAHWPATGQAARRGAAAGWPGRRRCRRSRHPALAGAGCRSLLDWLEDQPGATWQQRWLASGADAAGRGVADGARPGWLRDRGAHPATRLDVHVQRRCSSAVGADIVRPSLRWLLAGGAATTHAGPEPDGGA